MLLTQVPHGASPPSARQQAEWPRSDWFVGARVVIVAPNDEVQVLSEGFVAACDPNLSFDGRKVLFAGKREATSRWRIFEIGVDGRDVRAVTPEHLDARSAIYVSTLFTLNSPEPWFTTVFVGVDTTAHRVGQPQPPSLYNVKLDGTEPRRLTWTPHANLDPFQMWDGRVIYSAERPRWEQDGGPSLLGLHAIHIEGADMEFYGAPQGARLQQMPCATEEGLVVFVESDQPSRDGAGQLACVDESRPHHSYRRLTQDPGLVYLHPFPWQRNTLLVSRRPAQGEVTWGVRAFDADLCEDRLLYDHPDYHDVQPRFVLPRPRPDGHSTVVDMEATTGTFYGLNCYTADPSLSAHLRGGEVKRVRFIEGIVPADWEPDGATHDGEAVSKRLVGEAPVEADGSFNVEVPANTPLLLQTLDERGLALATCGWIWVQPKETRGCIGCHEDPELIPENEYVLALRRPSNRLTLAPEQRRVLSFREDIAPLLRKHCALAECHAGNDTPLHLPLAAPGPSSADLESAYDTLTAARRSSEAGGRLDRYITPGRARTSPLIWRLFGTETSRPWDLPPGASGFPHGQVKRMPPPDSGQTLRPEDIHMVVQWVDLGAPFEGRTNRGSGSALQQAQTR